MSKKIEKLTPEQIAMIPKYVEMGIKIGMCTDQNFDEALVRDLIDKHRVSCGLAPATYFKVYDSPMAAMREIPTLSPSNALYGQHDMPWLNFYNFWRCECGLIEETEPLVYLIELGKHIHWFWMSDDAVIVTLKPKYLHTTTRRTSETDTVEVLHNPDGMALEYRDGEGLYALWGTRLPKEYKWIIADKGNYDKADILKIPNTAIRTLALRMLGAKALVDELGTVIDTWESLKGGTYKLYEVYIDDNKRIYLTGTCPSKGEPFCDPVPPDIETCIAALKFREPTTLGEITEQYLEPCIRT